MPSTGETLKRPFSANLYQAIFSNTFTFRRKQKKSDSCCKFDFAWYIYENIKIINKINHYLSYMSYKIYPTDKSKNAVDSC